MDDRALLEQFIQHRGAEALEELVRRHIDLVYSAAMRQTRDHALAEDVTQTVFILLNRKGAAIRQGEALAGWLLTTTRFAAINALRAEVRRRHHERGAAAMKSEIQSDDAASWESIQPLLDEAVTGLKREDRDAITLRYFKGQTLGDVATALGISEPAAQKRVSRALERLRAFFAHRGVEASSTGLASLLAVNVITTAPAKLSARVVEQTLIPSLVKSKGAVILMAATKTKIAIATVAAIIVVGVSAPVVYKQLHTVNAPKPPAPVVSPRLSEAVARDLLATVYALQPGEDVKRVQPPFGPERAAFYQAIDTQQRISQQPDALIFKWTGDGFANDGMRVRGSPYNVSDILKLMLGIWPQDTDIPPQILSKSVPGDWVIRADAPKAQLAANFAKTIPDALGPDMTLRPETIEREVIVVRGTVNFTLLPDATQQEQRSHLVRIFRGEPQRDNLRTGGGYNTSTVLLTVGEMLRWPVVFETTLNEKALSGWGIDPSADFRKHDPATSAVADEILANVMEQTGLDLKRERRTVQIWRLVKTTSDDWRTRFNLVYGLAPAQNVKRVRPPFIPERQQMLGTLRGMTIVPQAAVFNYVNSNPGMRLATRDTMDLGQVLKEVASVWPQDCDVPRHMLGMQMMGDWVVRPESTQQQRLIDLVGTIDEIIGEGMTFQLQPMEREVIVVSGKLQFDRTRKPADVGNKITFLEAGEPRGQLGTIAQNPHEMLQKLGEMMARPVVVETEVDQKGQPYFITTYQSADFSRAIEPPDSSIVDKILQRVTDQTSLQFKRERRIVPTWRLVKSDQ